MALRFPDLRATNSLSLIACGTVSTTDKASLNLLKQHLNKIALFKIQGTQFLMRMMTGGHNEKHLHLEAVFFKQFRKPPKTNATRAEINKLLERFMGCEIKVHVAGGFILPIASLPETGVLRTLSAETKAGGISMKLTKGTLALSGSRVKEIEWSFVKKDSILIEVVAERVEIFSENYLENLQKWIFSLFELTVLGKETIPNA